MKSIPVFLFLVTLVWCDTAAADYQSAKSAYERGDYETALAEFRTLAGQDDPRGQFALGLMYQKGWGVDQEHGEALRWYQMAADQGVARAQNNLGVLYRRGLGVERSFERALHWFGKAAAQGFTRADFNLAEMHRLGEGVPRDPVQAYVWYEFPVTDLPGSGRSAAALRRSTLVNRMSVGELAEAEHRARAFRARREAIAAGEEEPDALPQLAVLAEILRSETAGPHPLSR